MSPFVALRAALVKEFDGYVRQAPHPNAGKVFIEYVLSKEGPTFIKNMGRVISRSDIP